MFSVQITCNEIYDFNLEFQFEHRVILLFYLYLYIITFCLSGIFFFQRIFLRPEWKLKKQRCNWYVSSLFAVFVTLCLHLQLVKNVIKSWFTLYALVLSLKCKSTFVHTRITTLWSLICFWLQFIVFLWTLSLVLPILTHH